VQKLVPTRASYPLRAMLLKNSVNMTGLGYKVGDIFEYVRFRELVAKSVDGNVVAITLYDIIEPSAKYVDRIVVESPMILLMCSDEDAHNFKCEPRKFW
jgi:hypothetical protein